MAGDRHARGRAGAHVEALIAPGGELAACGLLQLRETNDAIAGSSGRYAIPWRIDAASTDHFADFPGPKRGAFLGAPLEPSLNLSDYDHVAEDCSSSSA